MGQYDKDRHQKELAIRLCLARGGLPFLEVVVSSISDLSDTVEVLTDIDVLGIDSFGDGGLRRTIFDCKTSKMSAINRAFWASGVMNYTRCDEAFVLLKNRAVHNHRISALNMNVDIHDENSFIDLGRSIGPTTFSDLSYQSGIDRWNKVYDAYAANAWSKPLFELTRNVAPLSEQPWSTFRKIVAEMKSTRGQFDPEKPAHLAIIFDVLVSCFILWAQMGRDLRRIFEPSMTKDEFEKILRYYIWGGKESYSIRQQLRKNDSPTSPPVDMPSWEKLIALASHVIDAPGLISECAFLAREISMRVVCDPNANFDGAIAARLTANKRMRQFTFSMIEYLISAGGLPNDFTRAVESNLR